MKVVAMALYNTTTNITEFGLQTQTEDKPQVRDRTSKASSVEPVQHWAIKPPFYRVVQGK